MFWSFAIEGEYALFFYGFRRIKVHIFNIKSVKILKFAGLHILKINYGSLSLMLFSFKKLKIFKTEQDLNAAAIGCSNEYAAVVNKSFYLFSRVFQGRHYIRKHTIDQLRSDCHSNYGEDYLIFITSLRDFFNLDKLSAEVKSKANQLFHWASDLDQIVTDFNRKYLTSEKCYAADLLSGFGQITPTEEQLEAIVTFENNNLLVASAGSGKSATLINKVCYAIDKNYASSDEVLILAYGKDAAKELVDKFKEISRSNKNFEAPSAISTFHSLGYKIISSSKSNLQIAEWSVKGELFSKLLRGFSIELQKNPDFMWKFATLCSLFRKQNISSQKQHEYFAKIFSEIDDSWDLKQEVKKEIILLRTLKGDDVKSIEELTISNWYYLHSINYQYEKETDYKNKKGEIRKHRPDFFLTNYGIYHEHFALNKDGSAPKHFDEGYVDTAVWKRQWYFENKLAFIETSSAQFRDGSLFTHLEDRLKKLNVPIKFKNSTELEKIFDEGALESLINLIGVSIRHIRNQGKTSNDIALNPKFKDEVLAMFFDIVQKVLKKYEEHLLETQSLDFEGLLIEAADLANQGIYKHAYKLILVDEFQDISHSRLKLLLALVRQNPSVIVFAVGDDWQGIYKFSGADLDIFVNFEKYIGTSKEMYLTKTFRCNQGITTAAANFVQKNKLQKQKKAVSSINEIEKTIHIVNYRPRGHIENVIADIVSSLVERNNGKRIKVFILGRYNRSAPIGLRSLITKFKQQAEIEFKTFHKSKGLEADYCILVGMNTGLMSFPSLKEDHPLLKVFVENNDNYPYAEERRLFYVALTRAKNKVFLLCEDEKCSIFVNELIEQNSSGTSLVVGHA